MNERESGRNRKIGEGDTASESAADAAAQLLVAPGAEWPEQQDPQPGAAEGGARWQAGPGGGGLWAGAVDSQGEPCPLG